MLHTIMYSIFKLMNWYRIDFFFFLGDGKLEDRNKTKCLGELFVLDVRLIIPLNSAQTSKKYLCSKLITKRVFSWLMLVGDLDSNSQLFARKTNARTICATAAIFKRKKITLKEMTFSFVINPGKRWTFKVIWT